MPQTEVVNIVSIGETWNPEQYIKHWTIYQILNNLSNIEQFIKHWTIYQTLNNLSNPEQYIKHWTIKHWTIYQTLNNISNIEQFIKNWTIYQTLNNLSNIKQFIKHWTIYQTQLKLSPLPVKNKFKKIEVRIKKDFFAYVTPMAPIGTLKKCHSIGPAVWPAIANICISAKRFID